MSTLRNSLLAVSCLAVVAAVLVPCAAYAQPTVEWNNQYRPSSGYCYMNYGHGVAVDGDGNTYGIGYCYYAVSSSSYADLAVVSYAPDGTLRWARAYHNSNYSSSYEYAYDVDVDANDNVYVAGYGYGNSGPPYDCIVVSWDKNGNQRWVGRHTLPGSNYCYGRDVAVDRSSGDVYLYGYGYTGSSYDAIVIKYNNTGTQQWSRYFDYNANNSEYVSYGGTADVDGSGNFYGAGYTYGASSYGPDYFIMSYNSSGTLRFKNYYNNSGYNSTEVAYHLDVDSSGNSYVNGYSYSSNSADMLVAAFSSSGSALWQNRFDGGIGYYDYGWAVYSDDTNVYAAGYGYGAASGSTSTYYDIVTRSIDPSDGSTNWTTGYDSGTYRYDYCYGIHADLNGVYVVGSCALASYSTSYYDICILGHDLATGNLDWIISWDGGRRYYDYGRAIITDGDGCIMAQGYGYNASSQYVLQTARMCSEVECNILTAEAGGPYDIECNGQPTSFTVDGRKSCDPDGLPLTYSWTTNCPGGSFDSPSSVRPTLTMSGPPPCPRTCSVSLRVTSANGSASDSANVSVNDTTPPSFPTIPGNTTVQCDSVPPPAPVEADDACDPDMVTNFNENKVPGRCDGDYVLERTWSATDDCSNYGEDTQIITVIDTTPPSIAGGDEDVWCIVNPNHKYYCFDLTEFDPPIRDNCSYPIQMWFDGCVSDQPDEGGGDGNTLDDCIIDPDGQWVCTRVERSGQVYYGRRYEIWMRAMDDCGNMSNSTKVGNVYIPHDESDDKTCLKQKDGSM